MKKALFILGLVSASMIASGQGTVSFGNRYVFSTSPQTYRPIYGADWNGVIGAGAIGAVANRPAGDAYRVQLWMAIGYNQSESTLQMVTASAARSFLTGANAGYWSGESPKVLQSANWMAGGNAPVTLQVRVWDSTAADWDDATAKGKTRAKSLTFNYTTPAIGNLDPAAGYMENFQSFGFMPEPTTYALGLLGLGMAYIMRRRSN